MSISFTANAATPIDLTLSQAQKHFAAGASLTALRQATRYEILDQDDEIIDQCAGLMLVGEYVLTARHCIEFVTQDIPRFHMAIPRLEFLEAVRMAGLTLKVRVEGKDESTYDTTAQIAAIGAGSTTVNVHGLSLPRFYVGPMDISVAYAALDIGTQGDWAVLRLDHPEVTQLHPVPVSSHDYREGGTPLVAIGAPAEDPSRPAITGEDLFVCLGQTMKQVSGLDEMMQNYSTLPTAAQALVRKSSALTAFMTNPVISGYSGGPVLDETGADIGLSSYYIKSDGLRAYAPLVEILRQLKQDHATDPSVPDLGSAFTR